MNLLLTPWWLLPLLLAGLCGLLCPLLGTLLVLQQRVLTTNLMAYAVLPGVVGARALDLPPILGGLAGALGSVLLAELLMARRRVVGAEADAVLNTVLASSLGLGVLLVQALDLPVDLDGLLFGDLLLSGPSDLVEVLLTLALLLAMLALQFERLQWLGLDPEGAEELELPLRSLRLAMAALTALVVVTATAAVGLALVMALICAPALFALRQASSLARSLRSASTIGGMIALVSCGLALLLDLAPGPFMACCCLPLLLARSGRG